MTRHHIWSAINISEGQDLGCLKALALSLKKANVNLADWSADPDHNRSVFSLLDTASSLQKGIDIIFDWAFKNLNIATHSGQHPRLGAVDVVPFSPLDQAGMQEAKEVARACAQSIAEKFGVPIFLYRDSSSDPLHPLTLPQLRKGGLATLTAKLKSRQLNSSFGPAIPHPRLGVSVFGARPQLVAFNCMLDSADLDLGRAIAKKVRETGGGLDGVQALAFKLCSKKGAVQISMNLTKPEVTPPHLAYLKVVEEAGRLGIAVTSSELVGLVSDRALQAAFKHFLKIEALKPGQIAELNLVEGGINDE